MPKMSDVVEKFYRMIDKAYEVEILDRVSKFISKKVLTEAFTERYERVVELIDKRSRAVEESLSNLVENISKTIIPFLRGASSPKKMLLGESQYIDVKGVKEILEGKDERIRPNHKIKFSMNPMHLHSEEKEHYSQIAPPSEIVRLIEENFMPTKEDEYCDGVVKRYPYPKEDLYIIDLTLGKFGPSFWDYIFREGSRGTSGKSKPPHFQYRSIEIEFRVPKAS